MCIEHSFRVSSEGGLCSSPSLALPSPLCHLPPSRLMLSVICFVSSAHPWQHQQPVVVHSVQQLHLVQQPAQHPALHQPHQRVAGHQPHGPREHPGISHILCRQPHRRPGPDLQPLADMEPHHWTEELRPLVEFALPSRELKLGKKRKNSGGPGLDHDVPISKTSRRLSPLLLPTPHPPHLCRAGLYHSLLSDLSCNYDNTRFAVVLLEKSLDSATNSSKTCTSENLTCYQLSTTCLPPTLSLCVNTNLILQLRGQLKLISEVLACDNFIKLPRLVF